MADLSLWRSLGAIAPLDNSQQWQHLTIPLAYSLIRFKTTYLGSFIESDFPKGFVRLRIGSSAVNSNDQDHGVSEYWNVIFPRNDDPQIWDATQFVIPIQPNYIEIRRSTNRRSSGAQWSVEVQEFEHPDYLINYV